MATEGSRSRTDSVLLIQIAANLCNPVGVQNQQANDKRGIQESTDKTEAVEESNEIIILF